MSKTFLLKNTLTKLSTKNVAEFNLQNCPNFPSFRVRTWCGVWWYYWCGVVLWSGTMRWSVVMWCMVVVWCGMMWCMVAVWCGMMWCMVAVSYDVEMICWNMICYDLIWRGMIWYLMWCGIYFGSTVVVLVLLVLVVVILVVSFCAAFLQPTFLTKPTW